MTIRQHLDDAFSREFVLPKKATPEDFDSALAETIRGLPPIGSFNTIYRVSMAGGEPSVESVPESEWRLPQIAPPMSLQEAADESTHEALNGLFAEESDDE